MMKSFLYFISGLSKTSNMQYYCGAIFSKCIECQFNTEKRLADADSENYILIGRVSLWCNISKVVWSTAYFEVV